MSGIHLKLDWDEMIMDLDDASVGKMIKNAYNHMKNRELIEMDNMETKLYKHVILPVLNYNIDKYKEVCERNAEKSKLGVEKKRQNKIKETQDNQVGNSETHNNPCGKLDNPDHPKDKDKVKVRVREKAIDKPENEILDTISRGKQDIKNNFEKVYNIDFALISDKQTKYFCYDVEELVKKLGWDRFMFLVHSSGAEIIASTLTEYGFPELKEKMLGVKRNYNFFFNNLPLNEE